MGGEADLPDPSAWHRELSSAGLQARRAYLAGPDVPGFDLRAEAPAHKKAVVLRMKLQGGDSEVTLPTEYLSSCDTGRAERKYSGHKINTLKMHLAWSYGSSWLAGASGGQQRPCGNTTAAAGTLARLCSATLIC